MSRRRAAGRPPRQTPYKRRYPDGRVVWVARCLDLNGKARYAKPRWNGGKSSFALKRDAQLAIDEELDRLYGNRLQEPGTVESYFEGWLDRHPRAKRTNKTHTDRVSWVMEVEIEGRPLAQWQFDELRRRQVLELVDHMLQVEGRAMGGVRGILSSLSAMAEDAIGDDVAESNAFKGIRLRRSDPRAQKVTRQPRIWSFEQMRAFAAAGRAEVRAATRRPPTEYGRRRGARKAKEPAYYSANDYEALLLTPALTGLRLGEFLALRRSDFDGQVLNLCRSAHNGELTESSRQKNHERVIPVPPSLARLLKAQLETHDNELIFPTPSGRLWGERNFYRDVWAPAKIASGLDPTPHEFRHSYISHLRAAGIDDADLAQIAGHRVETMISVYTHALAKSHEEIKAAIG
jgi:integrase